MKKKKLVLAGFDKVKNFGDPILYRCAEYLIRDLVKGSDVEIVHLNLFGSGSTGKIKGLQLKAVNSLIWRIKKRKKADRLVSLLENHAVKTSVSRYYKRALKDASCLIFAGGGLIKYKYETFDYRLRLLIRQAEKQGIPVALNAVGVEDYSEANTRCQLMKKALNSPVVKMITTRDDIELLNNKYITNNDIVTARVADPAFWCDVVYNIKKKADSDVIGLGVVRSGIFKDNGIDLGEDALLNLWTGIIQELDKRGIRWELFTNGLKADNEFAKKLLDKLNLEANMDVIARIPQTPEELVKVISGFKKIIACRMHACIVAYSLELPAVGLVWNNKLKMFGQTIGQEGNFIEPKDFDPVHIVDVLDRASINEADVSFKNKYRKTCVERLREFLQSSGIIR